MKIETQQQQTGWAMDGRTTPPVLPSWIRSAVMRGGGGGGGLGGRRYKK